MFALFPSPATGSMVHGAATSDEAAAPKTLFNSANESPNGALATFYTAQPDSTAPTGGYFEDEDERKHLYRDIGVFIIVSAFVGYFIVKVFLEGETEEETSDDGGKGVPIPFARVIF